MTREQVLALIEKSNKGHVTGLKTPVELAVKTASNGRQSVSLKVRDDVNDFSNQEYWSYAYSEDARRVYFLYGVNAVVFKAIKHKGYHEIRFTNKKLQSVLGQRVISGNWQYDNEAKMYFIQF